MSNYNSLKTTINANIKQNGNQEITGQILNSVLNQMVATLGAGYQFAGVATTATNPGSPDAKVFYIANGKGTYTNFGGLEVTEDDVVVLYWDSSWHKMVTGVASLSHIYDYFGRYVENPEYIRAYVDAEGKFLWGIKSDGSVEWAKGVPSPIKSYLESIVSAINRELSEKVDKETGKGLSTNDFTNALKEKLDGIDLSTKVDKQDGKGLIDNNIVNSIFFDDSKTIEFIKVILDKDNKVLMGVMSDGSLYVPNGVIDFKTQQVITDLRQNNSHNLHVVETVQKASSQNKKVIEDYTEKLLGSVLSSLRDNNIIDGYQFVDYVSLSDQSGAIGKVISQISVDYNAPESTAGMCIYTIPQVGVAMHQYVAYYDMRHQLCVAYRYKSYINGTYGAWSNFTYVKLESWVGYDSHNFIEFAVDDNGNLHLSANNHADPLNYWISTTPYDISTLTKVGMVSKVDEERSTYPYFIKENGDFLFFYRSGGSGMGDHFINEFKHGSWQRKSFVFKGIHEDHTESVYAINVIGDTPRPIKNNEGFYEFFYTWRQTSSGASCKYFCYVKTQDFIHFFDAAGDELQLPITSSMSSTILDSAPAYGGIVNTYWRMYQGSGFSLAAYHKYDANGKSQIYVVKVGGDGVVSPKAVTNWDGKWIFGDRVSNGSVTIYSLGECIDDTYGDVFYLQAKLTSAAGEGHGSGSSSEIGIARRYLFSKDTLSFIAEINYQQEFSRPSCLSEKQNLESSSVSVMLDRNDQPYLIRYENAANDMSNQRNPNKFTIMPTTIEVMEFDMNI